MDGIQLVSNLTETLNNEEEWHRSRHCQVD